MNSFDDDYLVLLKSMYKRQKKFRVFMLLYLIMCVVVSLLYVINFINSFSTDVDIPQGIFSLVWVGSLIANYYTYKRSKKTLNSTKDSYYNKLKEVDPKKYLIKKRIKKLKKLNKFKFFKNAKL